MADRHDTQTGMLTAVLNAAGATVSLAVVAALMFGLIRPAMAERTRVREIVDATNTFLNRQSEAKAKRDRFHARATDAEQQLQRSLDRVPGSAQESRFLAQLSELADSSGLVIRQFRPAQPTHKELHSELKIDVHGTANYPSLCRFLSQVHDMPRLCRVAKLTISDAGPDDNYSVNLTVIVFFAPLEEHDTNSEVGNA